MSLLLDAVATYRLTRLLIEDDLLDRPRAAVFERLAGHPKLTELASCPWCLSVWCAFGVLAARRFAPRAWDPIARALTFSAMAGVMSETVEHLQR